MLSTHPCIFSPVTYYSQYERDLEVDKEQSNFGHKWVNQEGLGLNNIEFRDYMSYMSEQDVLYAPRNLKAGRK